MYRSLSFSRLKSQFILNELGWIYSHVRDKLSKRFALFIPDPQPSEKTFGHAFCFSHQPSKLLFFCTRRKNTYFSACSNRFTRFTSNM